VQTPAPMNNFFSFTVCSLSSFPVQRPTPHHPGLR
jgi:hypothetical protein